MRTHTKRVANRRRQPKVNDQWRSNGNYQCRPKVGRTTNKDTKTISEAACSCTTYAPLRKLEKLRSSSWGAGIRTKIETQSNNLQHFDWLGSAFYPQNFTHWLKEQKQRVLQTLYIQEKSELCSSNESGIEQESSMHAKHAKQTRGVEFHTNQYLFHLAHCLPPPGDAAYLCKTCTI